MILYYESLKIPFDHYKDHWIFQYVWVRQENVSLFIGWALGCEFCAFYFAVHWTAIDYHLNPYSIFACTLPRCRVHASPLFPTQKSTLGRGSKYPSIRNTGSDFSYRSVSSIHRSTSPNELAIGTSGFLLFLYTLWAAFDTSLGYDFRYVLLGKSVSRVTNANLKRQERRKDRSNESR